MPEDTGSARPAETRKLAAIMGFSRQLMLLPEAISGPNATTDPSETSLRCRMSLCRGL